MKTSTLLTLVAIVIMFFSFLTSTTAMLPYDPWFDTDDNGKIDIKDVGEASIRYGTYGTPIINRTALLLYLNETVHEHEERIMNLEEKVVELENKVTILNATKLGEPDYDSGWVSLPKGDKMFTHNLGTTNVLVYVIGNYPIASPYIHQMDYGGEITHSGLNHYGAYWHELTTTTITVHRHGQDGNWEYGRVMLWKLP